MSHNKELSIVPLYVYNTLTNYNNIYMKFKEKINLKGGAPKLFCLFLISDLFIITFYYYYINNKICIYYSHYYLSLSTYYIN